MTSPRRSRRRISRLPPASSISRRSTSPARSRSPCKRSAAWPIPEQFANIVIKQTPNAVVRLKDIGRAELSGLDYSSNSYLNLDPAVAIAIFQTPGSNALATAQDIRKTMETAAKRFPQGLKYDIVYDPTQFIQQSVDAVMGTILEAILLVNSRGRPVPANLASASRAIDRHSDLPDRHVLPDGRVRLLSEQPVAVRNGVGDRHRRGRRDRRGRKYRALIATTMLAPHDAAHRHERSAAPRSCDRPRAVRGVPADRLHPGLIGQFYKQFALTIAAATVMSLTISLTLSPALCALLLRPHQAHEEKVGWWARPLRGFFGYFNLGFDKLAQGYGWIASRVVRFTVIMLLVYAGIIAFGLNEFRKTPIGFIPALDRGYLIVIAQLPGASLSRTDEVQRRIVDTALKVPGVVGAMNIVGFSGATFTNAPNAGAAFLVLNSFDKRAKESQPVRGGYPARVVRQARVDSGCDGVRGAAAARHGHRQRRAACPHDHRRSRRPWPRGVAERCLRHDGQGWRSRG